MAGGEEESAEVRALQSQLGGLLQQSAALAQQHLAAAQSRIRLQAAVAVQALLQAKRRDDQEMQAGCTLP